MTKTLFIDVRSDSEWQTDHIENALHLPLEELIRGIDPELDKSLTIYAYCRSGNRSAMAEQILKSRGYRDVHNVGSLENAKTLARAQDEKT